MGRRQSRGAEATTTPTKMSKKDQEMDAKYSPRKTNVKRVRKYKQMKRAEKAQALQAAVRRAETPKEKTALASLEGHVYQPWKFKKGGARDVGKLAQLERLVREQHEEISALRRTLQGQPVLRLQPATPVKNGAGQEPDSSPVKIQQQLMNDAGLSDGGGEALEVEGVLETTEGDGPEGMEGVETTVTTTVDKTVEYPTLPSVEAEVAQQVSEKEPDLTRNVDQAEAEVVHEIVEQEPEPGNNVDQAVESAVAAVNHSGTSSQAKKPVLRDSSAESHAGTPRSVRRSPRKRTVKQKGLS